MDRRKMLIALIIMGALMVSSCQPDDVSPTPVQPGETPDEPSIPVTGDERTSQGEAVYSSQCASCHGMDGEGMDPQYPAVDGNPFVLSTDPDPVIDVVLHGRGAMPAFDGQLTSEEIAQVISYIRDAWTNDASAVTEEDVDALR